MGTLWAEQPIYFQLVVSMKDDWQTIFPEPPK